MRKKYDIQKIRKFGWKMERWEVKETKELLLSARPDDSEMGSLNGKEPFKNSGDTDFSTWYSALDACVMCGRYMPEGTGMVFSACRSAIGGSKRV